MPLLTEGSKENEIRNWEIMSQNRRRGDSGRRDIIKEPYYKLMWYTSESWVKILKEKEN